MRHDEDALIDRVAETLRKPERIDPSFDARVMAEVHALPAPRRRPSLWKWLMQPRPVSVSPIGGLAFGGAMAALFVVAVMRGEPAGEFESTSALGEPTSSGIVLVGSRPQPTTVVVGRAVQFAIALPRATRVAVVGDFNDWKPDSTMLVRAPSGVWTITIPLQPGRYTYNFLIDGAEWIADPGMPQGPVDEFVGRPTSVVSVAEPVR